MKNIRETQYGFTLLELTGVLLVSSILASMGIPMAMDMKHSSQSSALQDDFAHSLSEARTFAVSSGEIVSVCASADGEACKAGAWSNGWLVYKGQRVNNGDVVAKENIIDTRKIDSDDIELSVFDERLIEVEDIRFNDQGFNVAKQKISVEVCSAKKNLLPEAVSVARSGSVNIALREEKETHLKVTCS